MRGHTAGTKQKLLWECRRGCTHTRSKVIKKPPFGGLFLTPERGSFPLLEYMLIIRRCFATTSAFLIEWFEGTFRRKNYLGYKSVTNCPEVMNLFPKKSCKNRKSVALYVTIELPMIPQRDNLTKNPSLWYYVRRLIKQNNIERGLRLSVDSVWSLRFILSWLMMFVKKYL